MSDKQMAMPLAQEYSIIAKVPESEQDDAYFCIINPGLTMLANGKYLATVPIYRGYKKIKGKRTPVQLLLRLSEDKGTTWITACDDLPYTDPIPFVYENRLYLFIMQVPIGSLYDDQTELRNESLGVSYVGIRVAVSDDEGRTWTEPVEVIKGDYRHFSVQTGMVVRDGRLYWAISEGPFQRMAVASCDLQQGPLEPNAWSITDNIEMPVPRELNPGLFPGPSMRCLEGNVVDVNGRLRVLARAVIDMQGTANLAAIFDIRDNGGKPELAFTQLSALPGGQCKFFTVYDERSKLFWMASNVPANSQNLIDTASLLADSPFSGKPGNDRRFLMLWYACDALNWFPAGCIARAEKLTQSFMYPSLLIDGDDLIVLSRSSLAAFDQHDADLTTLHRIGDFRSLAMDIWPAV